MARLQLLIGLLSCLHLADCENAACLVARHSKNLLLKLKKTTSTMLTLCSPVGCLRCYTCVFPAISPMDCLKFPLECPAGQRCLSSVATGRRGAVRLTIYEKSCAVPAQCGLAGQKYTSGVYFNYTNDCCDTDLCNGAGTASAHSWTGALLCLLPALTILLA